MITAPTAQFSTEEARLVRETLRLRVVIFPFPLPTGLAAGSGTFVNTTFTAPNLLDLNTAAATGSWTGPDMTNPCKVFPVNCTVAWTEYPNAATIVVEYKTATTLTLLSAASRVALTNGGAVDFYQYYAFRFSFTGIRCYAVPSAVDPPATALYAVPAGGTAYDSYAVPGGGTPARVEGLEPVGEFEVPARDLPRENMGEISQENLPDFSDLVAGAFDFTLINKTGEYDPKAANFLLGAETDWYNAKVRFDYGFQRPGTHPPLVDWVNPYYVGEVENWNVLPSEAQGDGKGSVPQVELKTLGIITSLLREACSQPLADGTSNPLVAGEFIREAQKVEARNPLPLVKTADFEDGALDGIQASVGGAGLVEVTTATPITGTYSLRTKIDNGASAWAWGSQFLDTPSSSFFQDCWFKVLEMPETPEAGTVLLEIFGPSGAYSIKLKLDADTQVVAQIYGASADVNSGIYLNSYAGKIRVAAGIIAGNPGLLQVWINEDEFKVDSENFTGWTFAGVKRGIANGASANTWNLLWDDCKIWDTWSPCAYQVYGYPYQDISRVYTDARVLKRQVTPGQAAAGPKNIVYGFGPLIIHEEYISTGTPATPESSNFTLFPEYGLMVWHDWANPPSGQVALWLVKDTNWHPIDFLTYAHGLWGLTARLDATRAATAKAATPEYGVAPIGYYFEQETSRADVIREVVGRFLLSYFEDQGQIKIKAFTGAPLTSPALTITDSMTTRKPSENSREGLVAIINYRCGFADRNPDYRDKVQDDDLVAILGLAAANATSRELNFAYGTCVSCGYLDLVKLLAERLLLRLKAHPEKVSISGRIDAQARLELDDEVQVDSSIFEIANKTLRPGEEFPGCDEQLVRFPGVS